jgi:hypothetical protein
VIPSFGHIVNVSEIDKQRQVAFLALSFKKSRLGVPEKEPCTLLPKILIPPDMPLSAFVR